jgi:SecD/SecF fusion protein
MNKSAWKWARAWLIGSLMLASLICFAAMPARSQETAQDVPPAAAAETPAEASADATDEAANEQSKAAPTTETAPPASSDSPAVTASDEPANGSAAPPDTEDDGIPSHQSSLPAGKTEPSIASQAAGTTGTDAEAKAGSRWETFGLGVALVALFVVPIVAGNFLARVWKMPDHGWKISLVLFCLVASIAVCSFGQFKFGPDLAGGITLVYELADTSEEAAPAPPGPRSSNPADTQIRSGGREFQLSELIGALKKRLDPDGTKEITIRKYGPAVEIIIPRTGEDDLEFVKRRITDLGQLEFRITADPSLAKDRPYVEQAKLMPPSQKILTINKNKVAEWVAYDVGAFGPVDEGGRIVKRLAGDTPEALVLIDSMNVTGEYLTSATKGLDERGGPAVHFAFDRAGARRFQQLTSQNRPNPSTPNVRRNLGIILDKKLISAPEIRETISDRGTISGGSMTDKEVEHTIEVLNAGSLPAALNKVPISEWIISPTLGADTVEKGKVAILASLAAVVLFMIVYYRFAGIVACLALALNLLLVLALMVLMKAAFTLPGLAGLVLTIGMSVDANVLIYERIREELKSGAALRMAIRNGFSRAMSAIIDSNVTTIIAGIALFYIGTDQVKGFAVTLILGILTSMFTAIFCARLMMDVAERRGWIKQVRMMKILSQPNFDFLRVRWLAGGLSLVVILIGMVAAYDRFRRGDMLDIDFTGGSSVTFSLNDSGKMPISEVRKTLMDSELADQNLLIVELGKSQTRYSIDTNNPSVEEVKDVVAKEFGDRLMTYSLEVSDVKPYSEGEFTGTEAKLLVNSGRDYSGTDGLSHDALLEWLRRTFAEAGHEGIQPTLTNSEYRTGSSARFKEWTMRVVGLDQEATSAALDRLQADMKATPLFPAANAIGGRVSADMQTKALLAIGVSLLGVIGYLWLRFQNVTYGLAAGAALVHDVIVTIGMMALSAYVVRAVPSLAAALQLESFQISLTIVAALLTIIGYSLNDTIVTFDRLREVKGKSPDLTPQMVNSSVNQTLSRTILTATTVFMVVVILYFFGGEGIHSFAFAFLVGVIAGTYSTVYIAAPVLLWLDGLWKRYISGAAAPSQRAQRAQISQPAR